MNKESNGLDKGLRILARILARKILEDIENQEDNLANLQPPLLESVLERNRV